MIFKNFCCWAPRVLTIGLAALAISAIVSCGSGGGSQGTPVGPAKAKIKVNPNVIDSGDRSSVTIEISQLQSETIAIKVQFPSALKYIAESSFYLVDNDLLINTGPDEQATSGENTILVYYLDLTDLLDQLEEEGEDLDDINLNKIFLLLELEGVTDVENGLVGVDIDFDDPDVDSDDEFDSANPQFDAQDQDSIRVGVFTSSSSSSSGGT